MNIEKLTVQPQQLKKLLSLGNSDAVVLYLYLECGNRAENAAEQLRMNEHQVDLALALLRQMGLYEEARSASFVPGERPAYTEADVMSAMEGKGEFRSLYEEIQRLLGRILNTEELKILLSFQRYLGLPGDVISVLVCYCRDRARSRGSLRNPSLRTIEKEAYAWAEQGIDTLEQAAAFIQAQNLKNSRMEQLKKKIDVRGRSLTPGEERYAAAWLDMGFDMDAIALAYERTCLNTGGLSWAYMNKILQRWHAAGLHTLEQINAGDRKNTVPKGASGKLGQAELEAIASMMGEGK